jgi:hypothetical protein
MTNTIKKSTTVNILIVSMFLSLAACGKSYQVDEVMPQETLDEGTETVDEPATADDPSVDPVTDPSDPFPKLNPVTDKKFTTLPDGRSLSSIKVNGAKLSLAKGAGGTFSSSKMTAYQALKRATQTDAKHKVQWVFMDMDEHRVIEKSLSSNRKVFGASSSKIYVAAALLDKQKGALKESQLQLMADMLVVSSNTAWTNLQKQIGDGSADKGRQRILDFSKAMGYVKTRGFQGYLGDLHGNELVADEAIETLHDIYTGSFPGAELEWKIMYACRTGASRGRKYIPTNIYVAGKTGTYDGPTENPETGSTKNADGSAYQVKIRNHVLSFYVDGKQYGLVVLANDGADESAALLAGGLLREYTSAK